MTRCCLKLRQILRGTKKNAVNDSLRSYVQTQNADILNENTFTKRTLLLIHMKEYYFI